MRILISSFTNSPTEATYQWVRAVAQEFSRRKHEVAIVAPIGFDRGFRQFTYTSRRHLGLSLPTLSQTLFLAAKEFVPDHMLHSLWWPDGFAGWAIHQYKRIPYSLYAYGNEILDPPVFARGLLGSFARVTKKQVFESAKNIFCASRYTAARIQDFANVSPVPVGIGVEGPLSRSRDSRTGEDFRFLTIAPLERPHGVAHVIEGFARFQRAHRATLRIVGEGSEQASLEKSVGKLGIRNVVHFIPPSSDVALRAELSKAHVFISTPLCDLNASFFEGFGRLYLEAALYGVPSIASNNGGIPDAVVDGETGLLVNPKRPDEVAAAMTHLFENDNFRETLGRQALDRTLSQFLWPKVVEKMIDEIC